ncbi:MAG: hypothetical protein JSV95_06365 [Gemmatimonadota bacterium]|nr:MAG: hypothetical protein JSV95_06365 [Gemmatimonadota bacterium]
MPRLTVLRTSLVMLPLWIALEGSAPARGAPGPLNRLEETPEGVVARLYEMVTFPAGSVPDWDEVRSLFIDEAVVVLRTARDETTLFSLDGFIADFVAFIERAGVERTGFSERVIRMKSTVFGDIAHVLVLYEASIPGSARPPQQGVDSFQLIRRHGRWLIASVVNELPAPGRPVPPELEG